MVARPLLRVALTADLVAVASGIAARSGALPPPPRLLHQAAYATTVAASLGAAAVSMRRSPQATPACRTLAATLLALAVLPRTHPGRPLHIALGGAITAALATAAVAR